MSRTRPQEAPATNPKPKGHHGCICSATGYVTVVVSAIFPGVVPWTPGVRYWWREHSVPVLCQCPVGDWIFNQYAGEPDSLCPWRRYDPATMRLADSFEKHLRAWERGERLDPPAVTPGPDRPQLPESAPETAVSLFQSGD
jgi:hypothetical protein